MGTDLWTDKNIAMIVKLIGSARARVSMVGCDIAVV